MVHSAAELYLEDSGAVTSLSASQGLQKVNDARYSGHSEAGKAETTSTIRSLPTSLIDDRYGKP